ncbi:hypothetical protein [Fodinicola feengrottensis]|uniref:hypothetical protein n=1 Tax=Fodinicola feengrottensis TaxID=435914 RepID=UPI0013D0BFAD|nr:hypothetical protein [Fodinicola feengrottensis]
MVALFVRLKLSLLRNRFRQGPAAIGQLIGSSITVAFLAAMIVLVLFAARFAGSPAVATDVLSILQIFQLLGWAVSPLLAFGVDETLDPRRFALLPLTHGTLVRGLFAAALIGVFPIGNAIVLAGGAVAVANPWWTLVLSVPAAAIQLLMCVGLSRAMAATMAGLLRSRRGRDLAVVLGILVVLLPQGLNILVSGAAGGRVDPVNLLTGAANSLRWLPPGALAHVASDAGAGRWGLVALDLLVGLVAVVCCLRSGGAVRWRGRWYVRMPPPRCGRTVGARCPGWLSGWSPVRWA